MLHLLKLVINFTVCSTLLMSGITLFNFKVLLNIVVYSAEFGNFNHVAFIAGVDVVWPTFRFELSVSDMSTSRALYLIT